MPFSRPTLIQLNERVENQAKGLLGVTVILRRGFIQVISRVMAGISHLWHGHLDYNSKQFLPTTMDEENLIAYGGVWKIPRNEAVAGIYNVALTGTDGTIIPANTIFKRSDDFEYFSQEAGVISGGVASIKLVASQSGLTGELQTSDVVSLLNPIAGLVSDGIVSSAFIEPEDLEEIEAYRARVIDRIGNPISGGAATDYVQWAKEVAGVTRAWVLPQHLSPTSVGVTFVQDAQLDIVPSPAKVAEIQAYIEDGRRPVTADVTVFAPATFPLDLDISLDPNNATVQSAITEQIKDLIFRDASLAGAYKDAISTYDGKILVSRIREAVSIAVGENDHVINTVNSIAPADITPPANHLIILGTITWQNL